MLIEGLKLTCLGMGVVFIFLGLLVVVIKLTSRVLRSCTDKEEAASLSMFGKKAPRRQVVGEQQRIVAVITAALAMHRAAKASSSPPSDSMTEAGFSTSQADREHSIPTQAESNHKPTRPCRAHLMFHDHSIFQAFRQRNKRP